MDLFGTAGIRGDVDSHVTPELALAVGGAVADAIADDALAAEGTLTPEIVVARDGRVTGPALADAIAAGAAAGGARIRRAGMLPTPALAFASRGRYGIAVTASHNPPHDNGIKLFRDGVEFDRDAEDAVGTRVADGVGSADWDRWTDPESVAVLAEYREAVAAYARQFGAPLDGLRIAVDCGNGMASLATPAVLADLGAEVVTLNGNVDGHFPGRGSKPTPETLSDLRAFVADANQGVEDPGRPDVDGGFAFGIGHDGDADRIVIVDADGAIVHEDTVLAILAERYTRTSEAADPVVVTTPNASGRIDERVREAGGRVERVRLGALHEGIAAVREAAERTAADREATDRDEIDDTEVAFAAEPWKHTHTRFGGWIDGVCSAAVLARLVAAEGLDALRAPVTERPYRKVNVDCPDERKASTMSRLETALPEAFPEADVSTAHGVRLEFPDASWVLVRPSGTEPYVRLYAESDDVDALVAEARSVVRTAVESV
ncbi:phosphohexomutase domain-containing protein [Halopenitus persicus]|uniref:phosphomannomutase n=1 Tax=Halopenitus persicus TaxID=1048396 RepID=UPI000BBAB741|nr:phosphomannomutase [Halopenitus persicus]